MFRICKMAAISCYSTYIVNSKNNGPLLSNKLSHEILRICAKCQASLSAVLLVAFVPLWIFRQRSFACPMFVRPLLCLFVAFMCWMFSTYFKTYQKQPNALFIILILVNIISQCCFVVYSTTTCISCYFS